MNTITASCVLLFVCSAVAQPIIVPLSPYSDPSIYKGFKAQNTNWLWMISKLASIPTNGVAGPQGPVGPQGPQGIQGPAGTNGLNGINGTNGLNGVNGTNAIATFANVTNALGYVPLSTNGNAVSATIASNLSASAAVNLDNATNTLPVAALPASVLRTNSTVNFGGALVLTNFQDIRSQNDIMAGRYLRIQQTGSYFEQNHLSVGTTSAGYINNLLYITWPSGVMQSTSSNLWFATNMQFRASVWIATNQVCPIPFAGGAWLWNSNNMFYKVTTTSTNFAF